MASKTMDKFSNLMTQRITLSAANTLTFQEIELGLSIFDKVGMLLSRIEYEPSGGTMNEMTASGDELRLALTTSNQLTSLQVDEKSVIHSMVYKRFDAGTAGNANFYNLPFVHDFSQLPGGGILITPRPLYLAGDTDGVASPMVAYIRVYFTVIKLTPADYFELLETRQYFGA